MRVFAITAAANRRFILFLQHIINLVMSRQSFVSMPQIIKVDVAALSPATDATLMSFFGISSTLLPCSPDSVWLIDTSGVYSASALFLFAVMNASLHILEFSWTTRG